MEFASEAAEMKLSDFHNEVATKFILRFMQKFKLQGIRCEVSTHVNRFVLVVRSGYPDSRSTVIEFRASAPTVTQGSRLVLDMVIDGDYYEVARTCAQHTAEAVNEEYLGTMEVDLHVEEET